MSQILDLHIHSRYSRACSPALTLSNIAKTGKIKGVDIISTGDFTYPAWFKSIQEELTETFPGSGLYRLKNSDINTKFILGTELSLIYKDEVKTRRIHLVLHAPNLEAVAELNRQLDKNFNIRSDGRPILGMKAPDLVKLVLKIHPHFLIYPAHIWTPWFAVFGSKSGFDSLEECFQEQTEYIYAFETGLSSDPAMNWRLSALDNLTMLSSSDAHSLDNIGREANIMELGSKPSYDLIYKVIKDHLRFKNNSSNQKEQIALKQTLEFYPEEGRYHFDGHRDCHFSCPPEESKKLNNICPVCHKPLVIGVLNRIEELADRPFGYRPPQAVGFKKLVELDKIIAESLGVKGRKTKAVQIVYQNLINHFGNELRILLEADLKEIASESSSIIAEGVKRVREGKLIIKPGYDGEYGQIRVFAENDKALAQNKLF